MPRSIVLVGLAAALVSAVSLYWIGHRTRMLADRTEQLSREIRETERALTILRAERAFLTRAERIEPLARGLGMGPVTAAQFTSARALMQSRPQR